MKKTKHNYEKAFQSLANKLNPVIQKIEAVKGKKANKENLQIENGLLYKALNIYQIHINILDILTTLPIGSGAKSSPENEKILLMALEEFIIHHQSYPTEVQWMSWIDKQKYKPYQAAKKTTDTINGWSHAKLKQYLVKHKAELNKLNGYTKLFDMLRMN
jgi:hypothetical protein